MKKFIIIVPLLATSCFGVDIFQNAFNAGVLTPFLDGRTDIVKYYSGCRTLENFFVLSHGGVMKRPGTYYICEAKYSDKKTRLASLEYSRSVSYILEFGHLYIRFYTDGSQILDADGDPYEIVSPYDQNDVFDLQFTQSADTMYIANSNYPIYKLTRSDHDDWSIDEVEFNRGTYKDKNITDVSITVTGDSSAVGDIVTLDASDDIWNENHVGALWQLTHILPSTSVEMNKVEANTNSASSVVQLGRTFRWTTHNNWEGTAYLEKSYNNGDNWITVISHNSKGESNISFPEKEIVDDAIYRVRVNWTAGGNFESSFVVDTFEEKGEVKITAFTDSNTVTATVQNVITSDSSTKEWSEGAFSDDEGYPNAMTFFEERMVLAGTDSQPQTMWLSVTDDWENFYVSSADDSARTYTIASDQLNNIQWLKAQNALMIGTKGGEWKLTISDEGIPKCYRQSSYGSALIQPIMVNNVILYIQGQRRKVRELAYNYELDSWVSPDLSILASHIIENGIEQIAYTKEPDPMLWTVTDGNLAIMTYNRDQEVIAWQKIDVNGVIESVATIPREAEDEAWIIVSREIDSSTVKYIERFMPRRFDDVKDSFFVDSGLTYDGGASVTVTGITKAAPGIVTAAAHGLSDGDQVRFTDVSGMVEVNNKVYTVNDPATNTFALRDKTDAVDINSVGFTTYTSGGSIEAVENTFENLSHLENEVVQICADGGYYGNKTVIDGTITLGDFYNTVHAGLGYTAKLIPQRLEFQGAVTINKVKNIRRVTLRLYKSLSCKIGSSWTEWESLIFRDMSDDWDKAIPMFSGDKDIDFGGDYGTSADVYIQGDEPLPLTILFLVAEVDIQ